jgi:hypothetical protein
MRALPRALVVASALILSVRVTHADYGDDGYCDVLIIDGSRSCFHLLDGTYYATGSCGGAVAYEKEGDPSSWDPTRKYL